MRDRRPDTCNWRVYRLVALLVVILHLNPGIVCLGQGGSGSRVQPRREDLVESWKASATHELFN